MQIIQWVTNHGFHSFKNIFAGLLHSSSRPWNGTSYSRHTDFIGSFSILYAFFAAELSSTPLPSTSSKTTSSFFTYIIRSVAVAGSDITWRFVLAGPMTWPESASSYFISLWDSNASWSKDRTDLCWNDSRTFVTVSDSNSWVTSSRFRQLQHPE